MLTDADRTRLAKIAGLLASDKIGERAAAAAKASEILKRCGVTWAEALLPVPGPRAVVLLPADTSEKDDEIARLKAALTRSEARCDDLLGKLETERSVFWLGKDGGPWI